MIVFFADFCSVLTIPSTPKLARTATQKLKSTTILFGLLVEKTGILSMPISCNKGVSIANNKTAIPEKRKKRDGYFFIYTNEKDKRINGIIPTKLDHSA